MNEYENDTLKLIKDIYQAGFNGRILGADNIKDIVSIIEKQQKEIEKQQKEIKARLEEIDCLYKFISIREERIDELVEINEKYNDLYISKDIIKELKEIDNIDVIHCKFKELLGENKNE